MAKTATYAKIASTVTTGLQSTVTFTGITGLYTDLILVGAFGTAAASSLNLTMGNGAIDSGSNYSWTYVRGSDGTANSSRGSNDTRIFSGETNTANLQTNLIIQFQDYANTTTFKTSISRFNHTTKTAQATVGLWRSTSAIERIRVSAPSDFSIGTTFTLYGIEDAK